MKMVAIIAAGFLSSVAFAQAQTTVIEHAPPPDGVVVEHRDAPVAVEHRTTEDSDSGCTSTTVHKEDESGSKTVKKSNC